MMLSLLTFTLWALPLVLQAAIGLGMFQRRLIKRFPVFFCYTLVVLSGEIANLFFKPNTNSYALVYWCAEILAISLSFVSMSEILKNILPSYTSLRDVLKFVWILSGIFAVIALLMLVLAKPIAGHYSSYDIVMLVERSVRFLQTSLLIVVIALMSVLGLTWQHEALGILVGFGVYSSVALFVYEFGAHLHWLSHTAFAILNSAGYNLAVLIWAFYIVRAPQTVIVEPVSNADLAGWIHTLNEDVDQWSQER